MEPTSFAEENTIFDPPKEILDRYKIGQFEIFESIPACVFYLDKKTPVTVTCWKPTREEMEEIEKTGRIYLVQITDDLPLTDITVYNPLKEDK